MGTATAIHRRVDVVELADGIVDGATWPIVPDGEYLAMYLDHKCVELAQFRRAPKVFIRVQLFDAGEHSGAVLFRAYRVRRRIDDKRFTLASRSDLLKMFCRVLNCRTRPDRVSLRTFKGKLLRIRTRTVVRDSDQRDLPVALRYSVVDEILGLEVG